MWINLPKNLKNRIRTKIKIDWFQKYGINTGLKKWD